MVTIEKEPHYKGWGEYFDQEMIDLKIEISHVTNVQSIQSDNDVRILIETIYGDQMAFKLPKIDVPSGFNSNISEIEGHKGLLEVVNG